MGNDWIRDPLKLLIVKKLIVQSYDFVLTSSFQHFTLGEITITCLMGLAIYGILPWLNLVAEIKKTLHSEYEFRSFFWCGSRTNFTQPGKILREHKIVLVGFFLSLGYWRIGGYDKIQKVTNGWQNKDTYFFPLRYLTLRHSFYQVLNSKWVARNNILRDQYSREEKRQEKKV